MIRLLASFAALAIAAPALSASECVAPSGPIANGETRLSARIEGKGPPVLMIPSLGRGPADFDDLSQAVVAAGYTSVRYDPRWFGRSDGPEQATIADLAGDAAALVSAACPAQPVVVIGHALGNRIARALAATRPDLVSSTVLLAAGGQVAITPGISSAIAISASEGLKPDPERLAALRLAFFAPGGDASAWLTGWSPRAATLQARAVRATSDDGWTFAGSAPLLVIQPMQDPVAPPENGRRLADALGKRVTLLSLDHASHAILPEQPAAVAAIVTAWLAGERQTRRLQQIADAATVRP